MSYYYPGSSKPQPLETFTFHLLRKNAWDTYDYIVTSSKSPTEQRILTSVQITADPKLRDFYFAYINSAAATPSPSVTPISNNPQPQSSSSNPYSRLQ